MKTKALFYMLVASLFSFIFLESCSDDDDGGGVTIPDFNFPTTITFAQNLSDYGIYQGNPYNLIPAQDFHLLELSSVLFTDYSKKQRLVNLPANTQITRNTNGSLNFPDSTLLVKTFYYMLDERDPSLGNRIIETRLLIKNDNLWNIATYVWNDEQTDATLELNGLDTQVNWISDDGTSRSTMYHVPDENECIACHQSNLTTIPLGTTLRNLNRSVNRGDLNLNQISYFQSAELIEAFDINLVNQIVNYKDLSISLDNRARAYFHMNCAHCHNPEAWDESASQDLDFRYETSLNETGILQELDEIEELVSDGEMPFIGTTILDEEGVQLIIEYISTL